jgi:quinol monooxygenase YgiN
MNQSSPSTRTAIFHAGPDHGRALAERLLHAATLGAEGRGCERWLVDREQDDPGVVRVRELWANRGQCDAALALPSVGDNGTKLMRRLSNLPEVLDPGHRVGGEIYVVSVRVAPGSAREFEAGSAGLEALAFGSHSPVDREMVAERPTHE